jgi:hypothetical protein
VTTGAPKNFHYAKKRRLAAAFSLLAGLCPLLLLCAEFMIAPVPAAAQSIGFGGFGIVGGVGALGLLNHGFGAGETGGPRHSCRMAGLAPLDGVPMENLLPARSWDSRGFTNGPLTAPMAGSN